MNTILLREIQDKIRKEPRQFNIREWFSFRLPDGTTPPNCGTAACIAGWAFSISILASPMEASSRLNTISVFEHARTMLGLDIKQADRLFHECLWPKQFKSSSRAGVKLRAKRAIARIDLFINTNGRK